MEIGFLANQLVQVLIIKYLQETVELDFRVELDFLAALSNLMASWSQHSANSLARK
jgi:hypothetical protein